LRIANRLLLSQAFPVETHHTVKVERTPDMIVVATEEVIEAIRLSQWRASNLALAVD